MSDQAVTAVSKQREERMARVAVVTGGTRGIGRAISVALTGGG
jgi:NADP-dependent 3-hydroxy acid dehydrogenase YdfG